MTVEAYSIRSTRVVANGGIGPGVVHVRGEKIERVEMAGAHAGGNAETRRGGSSDAEMNVGDLVVMPGLVDTHVHVNEPGRTDWEGFETAGRAAAAGGITTIVVMPLNCTPAATSVAALMGEVEAARGKCLVDYGFWGGLVPGNTHELQPMWDAGVLGFKAFLVDSGVPDFAGISVAELAPDATAILRQLGAPLLVHAEDARVIERAADSSKLQDHPRAYAYYLASRPAEAEQVAVADLGRHLTTEGVRVHVVHVAETERVPGYVKELRAYEQYGCCMSAETCPHYLTFCAEEIPNGATQYKCAPPIRDRATREALWQALRDGMLTMVVSDHSPCPPQLKCLNTGNFFEAWGGISSLQLGLSATWTGASQRGFPLSDVTQWMCENPAKLAGLGARKGRLAAGYDADMVVFDPDAQWIVRGEELQHRHKLTPYEGMQLRGVVKRTILRGKAVFDAMTPEQGESTRAGDQDRGMFSKPIGQWFKRGSA